MFSTTNRTEFKLDMDYHNNKMLYFPTDKHLYIYKKLYNKHTTKALLKNKESNNETANFSKQFYTTIRANTTREYNKLFNGDYTNNKDYIQYSKDYDYKIKHKQSIEAFNEMLNVACNKLYETTRTNTKSLIVKCNEYIIKLLEQYKKTLEQQLEHKVTTKINALQFYTYRTRDDKRITKLCKNRCVKKLNNFKLLLKNFIKIVYLKVVVYNVAFKIAINKVLRSSIYNHGLGLKINISKCCITLID
jgi:hypothetical protein